eukprot:TRINITY_DN4048_c0_g1_i2.p1 TRINITY_DN4048_c0_g1~~TRINITY_DN4048_c0_g1_i2.p1  ORF type:complete len:439 (+),score=14.16 TRINITY_DN4048_c0_g1_i2:149-1318(+)
MSTSNGLQDVSDESRQAFAVRRTVYLQQQNEDDTDFRVWIRAPHSDYLNSISFTRARNLIDRIYFVINRADAQAKNVAFRNQKFEEILSFSQKERSLRELAQAVVSQTQNPYLQKIKVRVNLGKLLFRQQDPEYRIRDKILNTMQDFGRLCQNLRDTGSLTTQFCPCVTKKQSQCIQKCLINDLGFQKISDDVVITIYVATNSGFDGNSSRDQYVVSFEKSISTGGQYRFKKIRYGYPKEWFLAFMEGSDKIDARFKVCQERKLQLDDIPIEIREYIQDCLRCLNKREYNDVLRALRKSVYNQQVYINTSRKKFKRLYYKDQDLKVSVTLMDVDCYRNQQYEVALWSRSLSYILRLPNQSIECISNVQRKLDDLFNLYQQIKNQIMKYY